MTALDIRYGRQGGRRLPTLSAAEQAEAWAADVAAGKIVRASCLCTMWWLLRRNVGDTCLACKMPMQEVKDG